MTKAKKKAAQRVWPVRLGETDIRFSSPSKKQSQGTTFFQAEPCFSKLLWRMPMGIRFRDHSYTYHLSSTLYRLYN
jgi:hypothetical protein